jgi:hypothetical protein
VIPMPEWLNDAWPYLAAILPTICVAVLFYFLIKAIIEGDRRERIAQAKWESEHPGDSGHRARTGE